MNRLFGIFGISHLISTQVALIIINKINLLHLVLQIDMKSKIYFCLSNMLMNILQRQKTTLLWTVH